MAVRPIFITSENFKQLVVIKNIEFNWYPGFAISQKQKSINSLHENIKKNYANVKILEISSKSVEEVGRKLSAFNLMLKSTYYNKNISVECIFQGSKCFEDGGPYEDLLFKTSIEAKKDIRIKNGDKLKYFQFENKKWPLDPKTLFYDWIYMNALYQNAELASEVIKYDCFTDIEFNPNKSINCQAKAAAIFVSLFRLNLLEKVMNSEDEYKKFMYNSVNNVKAEQISIFS